MTSGLLLRKSRGVEYVVAVPDLVGHEHVPAVEQVELDGDLVRPVPALLVGDERNGLDREVERADVPDVLLDHELELEHGQDQPGGLEEAVVVPVGVLRLQHARDPVVLPDEQRVQDRVADRRVAVLETHREHGVLPFVGGVTEDRVDHEALVEQPVELGLERQRLTGLALLEEEHRELLAVDQLALQPATAQRTQHPRLRGAESVDLAQVDLLRRGVLAVVLATGPQEAVHEPLREEHEPDAGVRRLDLLLAAVQRVHVALGRQRRDEVRIRRRKVAAGELAVDQARPARVVGRHRQCARAQRGRVAVVVDHHPARHPAHRRQ